MNKLFNSVFIVAFLAAAVYGQLYYREDTTPSSGWLSGIFHRGDKSAFPESMEWSTVAPSTTPSSYWSYFGLGHHTTSSSLLRRRRSPQGPYGNRPQYRPYNRYPPQQYNRGWYQGANRPYYQRPIETTTPSKTVYMPGNGPDMPVASSTYAPQFGWGVTYKNGATVKPTTSTANPAAAWYQNWLNSLPDSLKSLYGVTTTLPPQGLVGRRRRRSAEDSFSTEALSDSADVSTESSTDMDEDTSTEPLMEVTKTISRKRRAVDEITSTQTPSVTATGSWAMIAIEAQNATTTASPQPVAISTSVPTRR